MPDDSLQPIELSARDKDWVDTMSFMRARAKDAYTRSLAADYLHVVDASTSGDDDHGLDGLRSVLHEQLLQALGETRETLPDMVAWARGVAGGRDA